ncbi:MAG: bifunctional nicotinamidase/pyrazinamidase [Burkholderiaceae bacterium]|nr:bifunctional nicotinamidase/pyrazinamidase [Burkholderiaceae bacterium]
MPVKVFTALVVVDVQNDFLENGALGVTKASEVIDPINRMAQTFERVIVTQDWHCADHVSFAVNHEGKTPGDKIQLPYGEQILWPTHCVEGTSGADLATGLRLPMSRVIAILKGNDKNVDSYSGFIEADRKTHTGFHAYCQDRFINRLYICGLATDFCVMWTALDAIHLGYEVFLVTDATRGINMNGSLEAAMDHMKMAGVKMITSEEVINREIK